MRGRIEEIFHEVVDLSADGRNQYFREHDVDPETLQEVAALLHFDSHSADTGLEIDIAEVAQQALTRFDRRGMLCGPYRLESLLGSGGMGSVYLADRVDGEVAQRVAIKLLRSGAESSRLYERFLAERQILANLAHPNIARLLDAGRTEDGQPYLVMEYVEGMPIDAYTAEFSIGSKVRLFRKVCAAVAYLHRNLVVHQDLKPANILVTAEGEPKLLDFGIAKIVDTISDHAATCVPLLTPDYASPEQVRGSAPNTAADVYSLGAVLYKLLTGVSPHRFEDDSVQEIVTVICSGRITPPRQLTPPVKRDLEIVVLKALRKEPPERYTSVEQFSDDLESFLHSRPIGARKGDTWYQVRKFLRRRGLLVAAASLAITGFSAGLFVANRERALAQERFSQVRQLADRFIELDEDVAKVPGTTKIREKMVTTALNYLQNLSRTSGNDAKLLNEIGRVYEKVAQAQGALGQPNLGRGGEALLSMRKAVEFEARAVAFDSSYNIDLANFQTELSYMALLNGRFPEAHQCLDAAASVLKQIRMETPDNAELLLLAAHIAADHADLSESEGNIRDKLSFFQEAVRLHEEYLSRKPSNQARLNVFRLTTLLASALAENRRYEDALAKLHGRTALIDTLLAAEPENPNYLRQKMAAANYEGEIYDNDSGKCLNKPVEAVAAFQRYREIARRLVAADPNNASARLSVARASYKLSWPLGKLDPAASVGMAAEAVRLFDEDLARNPESRVLLSGRARSLRHLAYALRRSHKVHEARLAIERAISTQQRLVREAPADQNELSQLLICQEILKTL